MRRLRYYTVEIVLVLFLAVAVGYFGYLGYGLLIPSYALEQFSGDRAMRYVERQLIFGDRSAGTDGNSKASEWLVEELRTLGWDVVIQPFSVNNEKTARNIIAVRGADPDGEPVAVISTHYDTRMFADKDADEAKHRQPTLGANAGAAGTSILLELARTLDVASTGHTVCLAFFDAEDNGGIQGWDYALGSAHFSQRLSEDIARCDSPRVAVYFDLAGGSNQHLSVVAPNVPELEGSLKQEAARIGYPDALSGRPARDEVDAVTRFVQMGIPAVMIADFNYAHRHTLSDTLNKLSTQSVEETGRILKAWLESGAPF